jgi:diadenosine tetraphosphate (Ap4A) HIT family hydrolase
MNSTIRKFGYPATLVREWEHWLVLLRPAQVTLGSLVIAAKSDVTAYGELARDAFTEQADVVRCVETALREFARYERINYLMLMMVDPHVHFHVVPRYEGTREWCGIGFPDLGWPDVPRLHTAKTLEPEQLPALAAEVASLFR